MSSASSDLILKRTIKWSDYVSEKIIERTEYELGINQKTPHHIFQHL